MTKIIALELENFQSIESRTRIDFKPITMLFGPNSAGKSSIFDALELFRTLLDPTKFDKRRITEMVDRWARRSDHSKKIRETRLVIEFEVDFSEEPHEMWNENNSNLGAYSSNGYGLSFWWDEETLEEEDLVGSKNIIRIEICLQVQNFKSSTICRINEAVCKLNNSDLLRLSIAPVAKSEDQNIPIENGIKEKGERWLTLYRISKNIFLDNSISQQFLARKILKPDSDSFGTEIFTMHVECGLSLFELTPSLFGFDKYGLGLEILGPMICQNATDIFFYLGTTFYKPLRSGPGLVRSDRRTPTPTEALAVVDLNLGGWWSRDSLSPSSPAFLLKAQSSGVDEHFQRLAELTHAELLLKAVNADFWKDSHAAKYVEEVRPLANQLERINIHLEESLFREKLYKLSCVSTLMVPIDLNENDPMGFYAFAQPAAVRLLLQDQSGQKIELQDVGTGIPFVLPVLYAATSKSFAMIQQPELHLHPALQSQIGDVFIEESNNCETTHFLIETHSEHLLLRLLRRIRDTEKGKSISDSLKLTNEKIAIYYFDPQISGPTSVTGLPITPLGDFYTDWPRGFFEERNDDLFDKE